MIKSKKWTAVVLTAAFTVSSLFTAFAEGSASSTPTTATSATTSTNKTLFTAGTRGFYTSIAVGTTEYETAVETGGYLLVDDASVELDITSDSADETLVAAVQEQLDTLIAALAEDGVDLINEVTGETVTLADVAIVSSVEVSWEDLGASFEDATDGYVWIDFSITGVTADNFVGALVTYEDGTTEFVEYEITADGSVSIKMTGLGTVSFLVVTTDGANNSSNTGLLETVKSFAPYYIAAVAIVAAFGCAISFKRKED